MSSALELYRRAAFEPVSAPDASPIKEAERLAARTPGAISLAIGSAPFDPPAEVMRALAEAACDPSAWRYTPPEGLPELRQAIADEAAEDGTRYDPSSEVVVSCGATEALAASLVGLLEPGDAVLMPSPSYVTFASTARLARLEVRRVPLARGATGFRLDLDALAAAIDGRTRAIVLSNPSNPTGMLLSVDELRGLSELVLDHGLLLVLDEVYRWTVHHGRFVAAGSLPELKPNLVRVFGFGKTYGMCGQRVGYALADRPLALRIRAAHDALANSAPHPAQRAALAALERCRDVRDRLAGRLRQRRRLALESLMALEGLRVHAPQATYFLFPELAPDGPWAGDDRAFVEQAFAHERLVLVPGGAFGPQGAGHVRLSYGLPTELLRSALARLSGLAGPTRGRVSGADR